MKAVSNTTPLRYLVAVGQERLLGELFEKIFIPMAVEQELTDPRTPEAVRGLVVSRPPWLEVRKVQELQQMRFPVTLHRGEKEAILLTQELSPDVLLIDEQIGRNISLSWNLPVSGTLGVLEKADKLGLIADFPGILQDLKASGFFLDDALHQRLLRRHRERLSHGL